MPLRSATCTPPPQNGSRDWPNTASKVCFAASHSVVARKNGRNETAGTSPGSDVARRVWAARGSDVAHVRRTAIVSRTVAPFECLPSEPQPEQRLPRVDQAEPVELIASGIAEVSRELLERGFEGGGAGDPLLHQHGRQRGHVRRCHRRSGVPHVRKNVEARSDE